MQTGSSNGSDSLSFSEFRVVSSFDLSSATKERRKRKIKDIELFEPKTSKLVADLASIGFCLSSKRLREFSVR